MTTSEQEVFTGKEKSSQLFIEKLKKKNFGKSIIKEECTIKESKNYHTFLISYMSDGLKIEGSMRIPKGKCPFPAVIINHGHSRKSRHRKNFGLEDVSRLFVQAGFIAFASDYRNYGSSDRGDDIFQEGYFTDVMNLFESIKDLSFVDRNRIGMWGHSMGGGFAIKAAVITDGSLKAISAVSPMSANEEDNYRAITGWHPEKKDTIDKIYGAPGSFPENYKKMSPCNYIEFLKTPIIIHHGCDDNAVPIEWSEKFYALCKNKKARLCSYENTGHTFKGNILKEAFHNTIEFFSKYSILLEEIEKNEYL